jgi:DNA-binding winged helix-turn-helix (wHTH) protein/thioredoxin-like negative regulator of GroEL
MNASPRGTSYRFPPFRLDLGAFRLLREDQPIPLAPKALDLLFLLVSRPAAMVSKEDIMRTLWPGIAVSDNALTQVVSDLRQALGDDAAAPRFIQTVPRRGYRFVAALEAETPAASNPTAVAPAAPLPAATRSGVRETSNLDAYRSFVEGRMKLERMDPAQVPSAIQDFERAIALDARYAPPWVGLAHARYWIFEASRARNRPDLAQLNAAIGDAHHAIELDPDFAEAHAALALMLTSAWRTQEAMAAGRRAVALEPGNWRNHCRLAVAAWGQERIDAFGRVLALYPDFAYAYYGIAMVHVARGDLAAAIAVLEKGIPFQDRLSGANERYPAKGLHWLLGLILLARDSVRDARAEFDRELASGGSELYAVEFASNAHEGHGFALLREGDATGAAAMFERALAAYPDHVRSLLGLAEAHAQMGRATEQQAIVGRAVEAIRGLDSSGRSVEAAIATAEWHAASGRPAEAATALARMLAAAPPGLAGWAIPIDPLIAPLVATDPTSALAAVLNRLADRAV